MSWTFEDATKLEWLETNGLGGYAGSTIAGAHTRRYHGLLIAAMHPPVERINLLSKLDETIIVDGENFELGSNQYKDTVHPQGYDYLKSFTRDLFPEWIYELPNGTRIRKTIAALHGENTTLIIYKILQAKGEFEMELLPLSAFRDFHALKHANNDFSRDVIFENGALNVKAYHDSPELYISVPGSSFTHQPDWYYNFEYAIEHYRGQDFSEDLFTHGKFRKTLKKGDQFAIIVSTENPEGRSGLELFKQETLRREKIISSKIFRHPILKTLALAADQFVVNRGADLKTIIAGYHWFSDWGRDTMIALPGLCLSTGRYEDAKKILAAFAKSVSEGMLPNRFPDYGEAPEYNTIDATLWFFVAIKKYMEASDNKEFVLQELLPVLKDIIDWHFKGTRYNIKVAEDGLLAGGIQGQQLTWMDARVGDWVVTPRMGKPVEINALWYNALMIYVELLKLNHEIEEAKKFGVYAKRIYSCFTNTFWNANKNCLFDVVNGEVKDDAIRPNQLLAISLPFPLVKGKEAESILTVVTQNLYTAVGLRSLSPDHPDYKPTYGGDQLHRDGAYHQGTVWSWLLGPYVDAVMRVYGKAGKSVAKKVIEDFKYHFNEGCIGTVSEIMDAEPPFHSRGCAAQAWSVGELLRVSLDYDLFNQPNKVTSKPSSKEKAPAKKENAQESIGIVV